MTNRKKNKKRTKRSKHPESLIFILIYVMYGVAAITPLATAFYSDEWKVSPEFVITAVVIPLIVLAFAFAIQNRTFLYDSRREMYLREKQSHLMSLLEESILPIFRNENSSKPNIRWNSSIRLMYEKIIEDVEYRMVQLKEHSFIEAYDNYWDFCTEFYSSARSEVECTSIIDLKDWRKPDMADYIELQQNELLKDDVVIRRTFIFKKALSKEEEELWRDICFDQLHRGFQIYYIFLDVSFSGNPQQSDILKSKLYRDYALIDQAILQYGCYSSRSAQQVLYYKFFALSAPPSSPNLNIIDSLPKDDEARDIFSQDDDKYRLIIQKHRKKISLYEWPHSRTNQESELFKQKCQEYEKQYNGAIVDRDNPWKL